MGSTMNGDSMASETVTFTIAKAVFDLAPDYACAVILTTRLKNGPSIQELRDLQHAAEMQVRETITLNRLAEHERVAPWRAAFRQGGMKPAEFRPAHEGQVRRVLNGRAPTSINAAVDIGTLLSLQHLVPVGIHRLDDLPRHLALRPATGTESFQPITRGEAAGNSGRTTPETPVPGEIVLAAEDVVLTRRWVWRQGQHSAVLPTTRTALVLIDGLPPVTVDRLGPIATDALTLLAHYCGGQAQHAILDRTRPQITLIV